MDIHELDDLLEDLRVAGGVLHQRIDAGSSAKSTWNDITEIRTKILAWAKTVFAAEMQPNKKYLATHALSEEVDPLGSSLEITKWLNIKAHQGLYLVAVDRGLYIFEERHD
jgi:hypothetical protein